MTVTQTAATPLLTHLCLNVFFFSPEQSNWALPSTMLFTIAFTRGRQWTLSRSTVWTVDILFTKQFKNMKNVFFAKNFRYMTSSRPIIWRYAAPCRPVIDCKNEWPRMTLSGYIMTLKNSTVFALAVLDSEGSTFKHNCMKTNEHITHTISGENVGQ